MADLDQRVRLAAFAFLEQLQQTHGEMLPYAQLLAGFEFEGKRVPLLAPQGIFKPAILDLPLRVMARC
jgi:putative restriction endonuclease